jgi:acyl transferase domain-containing protein/acyl carrier protein
MSATLPERSDDRIAIVGMACRVPGASDLEAFWRNLVDGVESIETLSDEELRAAGVPESLLQDPRYVRAGGFLPEADGFDAALFNCTPREASMLDPQHRLLMECAWHALEHAGHANIDRRARAGVYVGVANSSYYHAQVRPSLDPRDTSGAYQALICGERDFIATRLSYYFDLTGPSINVQTACSTSLVAVHLACQALLAGECDLALAGGAAVRLPQRVGYLYEEGMILSRDGHCRPFDAAASGTVVGNGAGMVVLRRLEDALADGDTIHALILGSAMNNDGAHKVGYTAPGVEGQAGVVLEAQMLAGVPAASIAYIEAHGTGTPVGDPIEVAALTEAFRRSTGACGYCALGSVKSNLGHLDIAAGIVGLIKAALAVSRGVIPPSLHFHRANPVLSLETTPFYVPQSARPWPAGSPRRAGVSAFGMGGTNAHIVLEAAEDEPGPAASRPWQVLCISGKTAVAVRGVASALAGYLADGHESALPDVAFTLGAGRRPLEYRHALVCGQASEVVELLRVDFACGEARPDRRVDWIFPDTDAAHAGMGEALAAQEPVFRAAVAEALAAFSALQHTASAESAAFSLQYGLAALWRAWGVEPRGVCGMGTGEYAAAAAAGVLTLAHAARLIAARGRVDRFNAELATVTLHLPSTRWLCARTGSWIESATVASLDYWLGQTAQPPQADKVLRALLDAGDSTVLELGPGTTFAATSSAHIAQAPQLVASCAAAGQDVTRALAHAVARLWMSGVAIDWLGYYGEEIRRRLPLPLYPFERTRRWIDAPAHSNIADKPSAPAATPRAFRPTWTRAAKLPRPQAFSGSWLIIGDVQGLSVRLTERLTQGGALVASAAADSHDIRNLVRDSRAQRIVHLGASYESLVALGRMIVSERIASDESLALFALTEDMHQVSGAENVFATRSLALGPLRVLQQEHPEIRCRNIDISSCGSVALVDLVLAECMAEDVPSVVAIRGGHRWFYSVEPSELTPARVRESGERPVYLISGGLGLVGLALAQHLHESERAKLVLLGRSEIPPATEWQADGDDVVTFDINESCAAEEDSLSVRLRALAGLQRAGAELLCVTADVSDAVSLRRAFAAAESAFGRVDVVVHAAGAPARESFTPFEELTPELAQRQFGPKVDGVEALRAIAREKSLRACVLMSSLSSVLGGLGFSAYAAANAYLDAVAQCEDGVNGVRWVSIGWDAWQSPDEIAHTAIAGTLARNAISPAQGAALFSRVLASESGAHLLISSTDLVERVKASGKAQWPTGQAVPVAEPPNAAAPDTEGVIASTWMELLGVDAVAPGDDFYELGGNSLLATQVVSRLRRAFGIEISVRVLFEETTVAGLAKYVDARARELAVAGSASRT